MLKPKQNFYYPFTISIPNPYENKSPHKISPKLCSPCVNTFSHFDQNIHTPRQASNCNDNRQRKDGNKPSFKKHLTLDHCLFQNETDKKFIQNQLNQSADKSVTKIPTNPFEQILNQSDTPDFNLSLPFADEFSKIDLKSPTFSDIFTMSQIKSPQFKNENNNFFMTARKKPIEVKESLSKTVKLGEFFRKDQGEEKFLQKMDRCISEMKIQKLQISNQLKTVKNKDQKKENFKKLSIGYKLKNHFNPSTPKLAKLPQGNESAIKTLQKSRNLCNYISIYSNPEEEGKIVNPVAINYPKSPKLYKFSDESNKKVVHKQQKPKTDKQTLHGVQGQRENLISYKMPGPRGDLKEEMEEIYNGKFKLQKSVRY